jgi:ssRNA-specific RNase YbeY (16S rRNA maturation enzyme)
MDHDGHSNLIVEVMLENPSPELAGLRDRLTGFMEGRGRIEVVVCDPGMMRMLNRRFRMIDKPTDVLTFDLSDPGGPPEGPSSWTAVWLLPFGSSGEGAARLAPPAGFSHHTPDEAREMELLTNRYMEGIRE